MNCTEIFKARVTPEIKRQVNAIADRELLTEAAWVKRVVMKEVRCIEGSGAGAAGDQCALLRGNSFYMRAKAVAAAELLRGTRSSLKRVNA